jgi:hypothetical protein
MSVRRREVTRIANISFGPFGNFNNSTITVTDPNHFAHPC